MNLQKLLDEIKRLKKDPYFPNEQKLKGIKEAFETFAKMLDDDVFFLSQNMKLWQQINDELEGIK